jgi:hypothetical protein
MNNIQQQEDIFGLSDMPEEARDELYAALSEVVYKGVMRKTRLSLDTKNQQVFTELLEASADDPENEEKLAAIEDFIAKNVPDYDRYVTEQVDDIKKRYQDKLSDMTT